MVSQSGYGPTWTQKVTELLVNDGQSDDSEEKRLRSNTGINPTAQGVSSAIETGRYKEAQEWSTLRDLLLRIMVSKALMTKSNHIV